MRTGWFREVHVKSDASYRLRLLLTQRRNLKRKFLDIENAVRHSIKTTGSDSAGLAAANSRRGCASWWQMIG
jgi:transposase